MIITVGTVVVLHWRCATVTAVPYLLTFPIFLKVQIQWFSDLFHSYLSTRSLLELDMSIFTYDCCRGIKYLYCQRLTYPCISSYSDLASNYYFNLITSVCETWSITICKCTDIRVSIGHYYISSVTDGLLNQPSANMCHIRSESLYHHCYYTQPMHHRFTY